MELPAGFNLRALRVFNMVAEAGNMTKAAENLRLTQSCVSETISQLEKALGAKLFDRNIRPIRLTHTGSHLYQKSDRLLQNVADAFHSVRNTGSLGLPSLTIAMVESTADILGPSLVSELNFIAARWRIWSGISLENQSALMSHAADIIITGSDEFDKVEGVERFPLIQENFVVVIPRDWNVDRPDLAELSEYPFVRYSQRSAIGQQVERQINRLRLRLPFRSEFDTIAGVQSTIANGLGWSFSTPLCLMNEPSTLQSVVVLPLETSAFSRRLTLVGRKGVIGEIPKILAQAARRTIRDLIDEKMRARLPWLAEQVKILE